MTEKTADELRAQAAQHEQDAADSFERCDTDGFVSQWASGVNAQKARYEADLVEAGGIATFAVDELYCDGEKIAARKIGGRYGDCFVLDAEVKGRKFVGLKADGAAVTGPRAKQGFEIRERVFVAEAAIRLRGSNAVNVTAVCEPKERKTAEGVWVNWDRVVGLGDLTDESEDA
jgi:hypothetical protein